ncbi:MAG: hypothetical protein IID40_08280 [Planctomycetes bacterium]|nr:hypothetical protein [Planctomycetota bacterium]
MVSVGHDDNGRVIAQARDRTGEAWQVWTQSAYTVMAEPARQLGIELHDG